MTARTLVVTGTDTGVGKTLVACALIERARARGMRVCGYKPVASGCVPGVQGLRNDDALALQAAAATSEPYERINPYAFEPAIAPHLAAALTGSTMDLDVLDRAHAELAARYELIVVEGAGGWQVPLNRTQTFADWVAHHRWPVLLVVGVRLGCLNHALLSAESIGRRTAMVGWVANVLPPAPPHWRENVETLRQRLLAPQWAVVPEHADSHAAARALDTDEGRAGLFAL